VGILAIRRPAMLLGACMVIFLALGAITSGLGAALPALRAAYQISQDQVGLAVGVYNAGGLAAMGILCVAPQASPRLAAAFQACAALGAAGMACSSTWSLFLICALIAGMGYGALIVLVNTYVAQRFPDHRVRMLGLVNATYGAGAIIGPVVAGIGPGRDFLAGAIAIALCAGASAMAPERGNARESYRAGWHARLAAPLIVVAFLYAGLETGIGSWGSFDLVSLGYPVNAAAQLIGLFWIGLTLSRLCMPALGSRAKHSVVLVSCVCAAGALVPLALIGRAAPVVIGLVGLAVGPIWPSLMAFATGRVGVARGIMAGMAMAETVGNIVMPLLIGLCLSSTSAFYLPVAVAMTAGLILAISRCVLAGGRLAAADGA
jgi:FHS family glucose/mannose:H+ symporter-like MFS transporter